jgi:hypothetical protein
MNLLTTGIQDLIDKKKEEEENTNLLVTLHQEEDAEYAALMVNYFQNDHDRQFLVLRLCTGICFLKKPNLLSVERTF